MSLRPFRNSRRLSTSRIPHRMVAAAMLVGILVTGPFASAAEALAEEELDSQAVAAFFDANVPPSLDTYHVPGAAVAVVSNGEVVFAGGYGMANRESGEAFDAATSMVRIASISKLFTWTAVMQLVEAGDLRLDADVNTYLEDFQIPATYSAPITLDHLMTHTAGFEDRGIGIGAREKSEVPPLAEFLADHVPARVRPPGEITAYSNFGAALAGHIVAQVSGQDYERYIQDNILDPLEMRNSTAWEPVPDAQATDLARSYEYVDGEFERIPFVFDRLVPDGSISASAVDMAHFMIAHLNGGRFGDARLLDEDTVRLMHEQSYTADPALSGWAHGFKERRIGGHDVILHDGSWEKFQSVMILSPDHFLGLFISYNAEGGIDAATELIPSFFERFFPTSPPAAAPVADEVSIEDPSGFYQPTRSSETTISKLLTLVSGSRLSVSADGLLRFGGREWEAIGPMAYQEVAGEERLAFVLGQGGQVQYLATDGPAYEKLAWYETIQFNLVVILGFLVPALAAIVGWPAASLVRHLRRRPALRPPLLRARCLLGATSAVGVCFLVLLGLMVVGDTGDFLYGPPMRIQALLLLPLVFIGLMIVAIPATVKAWRDGRVGLGARAHHALVIAGMVALSWFLVQWNLVGWHFG
jgi:CubicO group peptidase (beta-lactamase class C family)